MPPPPTHSRMRYFGHIHIYPPSRLPHLAAAVSVAPGHLLTCPPPMLGAWAHAPTRSPYHPQPMVPMYESPPARPHPQPHALFRPICIYIYPPPRSRLPHLAAAVPVAPGHLLTCPPPVGAWPMPPPPTIHNPWFSCMKARRRAPIHSRMRSDGHTNNTHQKRNNTQQKRNNAQQGRASTQMGRKTHSTSSRCLICPLAKPHTHTGPYPRP